MCRWTGASTKRLAWTTWLCCTKGGRLGCEATQESCVAQSLNPTTGEQPATTGASMCVPCARGRAGPTAHITPSNGYVVRIVRSTTRHCDCPDCINYVFYLNYFNMLFTIVWF